MLANFLKDIYHFWLIRLDRLFIQSVKRKEGVVIVRIDAIGDFVIWSHSAEEYRNLFPGKKITLIANKVWEDLALQLPYWDEVLPIDFIRYKKNPIYRWKVLHKISKQGFEIALQPTYSRNIFHGDSIIRATEANERIGSTGDLSNVAAKEKLIANKWYTHLVPYTFNMLTELERSFEFVNALGGLSLKAELRRFPVFQQLSGDLFIKEDYVIIFPGASWQGRQWPADRFSKLIYQLAKEFGSFSVLCGSANEWNLCQQIIDASKTNCLNLAGKTSLIQFVELVRKAKLVIGNETSVIHIAAAVGVTSICITGGGHFGRFVPYPENVKGVKPLIVFENMHCFHCNWQCTQNYNKKDAVPCIDQIHINSVVNLVRELKGVIVL